MAPITQDARTAVLAATKINRTRLLSCVGNRRKLAALVRSVTKRLVPALSAGTPVIGLSLFNRDWAWAFLGNFWSTHKVSIQSA